MLISDVLFISLLNNIILKIIFKMNFIGWFKLVPFSGDSYKCPGQEVIDKAS
jgi:hypothetical protein